MTGFLIGALVALVLLGVPLAIAERRRNDSIRAFKVRATLPTDPRHEAWADALVAHRKATKRSRPITHPQDDRGDR